MARPTPVGLGFRGVQEHTTLGRLGFRSLVVPGDGAALHLGMTVSSRPLPASVCLQERPPNLGPTGESRPWAAVWHLLQWSCRRRLSPMCGCPFLPSLSG